MKQTQTDKIVLRLTTMLEECREENIKLKEKLKKRK